MFWDKEDTKYSPTWFSREILALARGYSNIHKSYPNTIEFTPRMYDKFLYAFNLLHYKNNSKYPLPTFYGLRIKVIEKPPSGKETFYVSYVKEEAPPEFKTALLQTIAKTNEEELLTQVKELIKKY